MRLDVRLVAAFFAVYVIWGSTYLAIRVAVETIPPLATAGLRHLLAGAILFVWARAFQARVTATEWRASLVVGTHSHVPTADAQILNGGTAYQTDAGACADYDSVIGNQKEEPLRRFTTRISGGRYKPAEGPATVCGVYLETDDRTGLARRIEPIRIGGRLKETVPDVSTVAAE